MRKGRQALRRMDFDAQIQDGQNPKGFTAQTTNGTAHWRGTGWNHYFENNYERPQLQPGPTRPDGHSNRTGE